jgi:N-acetylmuramic acid 6-phosphate etherase
MSQHENSLSRTSGLPEATRPLRKQLMSTERISPRYADLDAWGSADMVTAMWDGQMAAVAAVRPALPDIARAVDAAAVRLGDTGRIVYVGAGTSGRLGVQDGSELSPTFSWPFERIVFQMAGGPAALLRSAEGAEDDAVAGGAEMDAHAVSANDVVIGIAASGGTPYTIAAIRRARERGAVTIGIACNPGSSLLLSAEHAILTETGEEVIAGSTRMKAGTAHKVVLNLLSSGIMVRLGRVYGGIMVDMKPSNLKLKKRAVGIVTVIAACSEAQAAAALDQSDGDIKTAVLVAKGLNRETAEARLLTAKGRLRAAMLGL